MTIEIYSSLPQAARDIRVAVFVAEQGFMEEFDQVDPIAAHILLSDPEPVGVCRVFPGEEPGVYILGRLAVLPQRRGGGLGARLVAEAEAHVRRQGGCLLKLHAQCRASGFYEKLGYQAAGPVEEEEGVPHIWMHKVLKAAD